MTKLGGMQLRGHGAKIAKHSFRKNQPDLLLTCSRPREGQHQEAREGLRPFRIAILKTVGHAQRLLGRRERVKPSVEKRQNIPVV